MCLRVLFFICLFACVSGLSFGLTASDQAGTDLADLLGANRFYEEGILGQGVRAAVIEGGLVWNGDSSTSHVTNYFRHEDTWSHDFGDERDLWDRHATWSGTLLGGRGPEASRTGIAPMVELSSGATATRWAGASYSSSWLQTATTVNAAYTYFNRDDPVDVISSSWGFTDSAASTSFMVGIDALSYQNPSILHVAGSGNRGFSANSVVAPASGMNVLSIGGLGYEGANYDARWVSSGRGLSDYFDPVNGIVRSVRASVDLLAPAQNIAALRYGGLTGGNNPTLVGSVESATRDSNGLFGTSVSAPIAAGGAALLYSLSQQQMTTNDESRDARVIKAVLLNSADKLTGWDAGMILDEGVWTTEQGLDAELGAGRMNLSRAYDQYSPEFGAQAGFTLNETFSFLAPEIGWDLEEARVGESYFYDLGSDLLAGGEISASLVWFRERREISGTAEDLKQANFDLFLWVDDDGDGEFDRLAQSISEYNTTEHLALNLKQNGHYKFEVLYAEDTFRMDNAQDSEAFAFAWSYRAVPEVSGYGLLLSSITIGVVLLRRR